MKKLLTLFVIGTSLILGSNPSKADEYQFIKGVNTSISGTPTIQLFGVKTDGSETLLSSYGSTDNNVNTINNQLGTTAIIDQYQGKIYFNATELPTDNIITLEYDLINNQINKLDNVSLPNKVLYPKGISSIISDQTDGSIQIGANANDIDVVADGLNIDGAAVITKNADGTIQIGTDENDIDITSEGLAIDGEPLITKKANGELHIGKNSWITKEENGRQKVYAKDANGNPIPIDYTNGTKLLINGRDVEQSINNVGALSAALTGLPTVPTDTTLACGLGTGTHGGDFAFSGGCASKVNEKLSINYAVSMTMPGQDYAGDLEDKFSARAGFVWKLGKATKPTQISMNEKKELKKEIADLKENNKNIIAQNNALLARLERIEKVALGDLKTKDLASYKLQ